MAVAYVDKVWISKDLKVAMDDDLYGATFGTYLILQFNTKDQCHRYETILRTWVCWNLEDKLVYGWSAQEKLPCPDHWVMLPVDSFSHPAK